jgi:hypothetical protein
VFSLSTLLLAMVGGFWLFALWRVIASGNGVAQSCFFAGYWPLAIVVRLGRPFDSMAPIWAPFLYPYTWCGIAALFWAASQLRATRRGVDIAGAPLRLAALFLALLTMHAGVALAAPWHDSHILSLYLMVPPAMVLLALLLYLCYFLLIVRPGRTTVAWGPIALLLLLPLGWLKLCERAIPAIFP